MKPGNLADLVPLDAGPVADMASTKRVAAAVLNRRLVDGAMRHKLLDNESAARKTRN